MKYLGNHFFLTGDLEISEELCKQALHHCDRLKKPENSESSYFRRDIYLLKSEIFFILGKIYHQKENYENAKT